MNGNVFSVLIFASNWREKPDSAAIVFLMKLWVREHSKNTIARNLINYETNTKLFESFQDFSAEVQTSKVMNYESPEKPSRRRKKSKPHRRKRKHMANQHSQCLNCLNFQKARGSGKNCIREMKCWEHSTWIHRRTAKGWQKVVGWPWLSGNI